MATRFYLPSVGITAISASLDQAWERNVGMQRRHALLTKEGTAHLTSKLSKSIATDPGDILMYQAVYDNLQAQVITGTVKGIIQGLCDTSGTAHPQMMIRVVAGSNLSASRGALLSHSVSALSNEFNTTIQNRKFPLNWTGAGTTLTAVSASEGDSLVIDIGARMFGTAVEPTFSLRFGNTGTLSDLSENETDTADGVPWIEFSQTLLFFETTQMPGLSSTGSDGGTGYTRGTQPKYYKMRGVTSTGSVTWINVSGDDVNRPVSVTGSSQIVDSWYIDG